MSVKVNYKGEEILSVNTDTTKTLKTSGKYCEGDIEVINTQDGGITPSGSISITENGTYDVEEYAEAVVNVSGGGEITDGIVVKARNAQEYPTEIDLYASDGKIKESQFFCQSNAYGAWIKLATVNLKNTITNIGHYAFYQAGSGGNGFDFDFTNVTSIYNDAFESSGLKNFNCPATVATLNLKNCIKLLTLIAPNASGATFSGCTSLTTVHLPKVTALGNGGRSNCRAVTSCEIGSIGYGNPGTSNTIGTGAFTGWTQEGLTITIFASNGATVDNIISCIRAGATNATIIVKASQSITYNGAAYSAGETVVTSEVA